MPEWVDPIEDPRWSEQVLRSRAGVFHSPPWLDVLRKSYGFDVTALMGDVGGGIPFVRLGSGKSVRLVSLPFSDYAGPMSEDRRSWEALSGALAATGLPVRMRTLADGALITEGSGFALDGRAHWHGIEIGSSTEAMWDGLSSNPRGAVRKAAKAGVVIRRTTDRSDLRAFHALQLEIRKRKYRLLAQPYRFFEQIWSSFVEEGLGHLRIAEVDGQVIAGALFLEWDDVWVYKFAASALDAVNYRPNDAILWDAMVEASEAGVEMICLGLTDWEQDGLVRFKEKYATRSGVISTVTSGVGAGDAVTLKRRMAGVAARAATNPRVPDSVTDWVGTRLYRVFA